MASIGGGIQNNLERLLSNKRHHCLSCAITHKGKCKILLINTMAIISEKMCLQLGCRNKTSVLGEHLDEIQKAVCAFTSTSDLSFNCLIVFNLVVMQSHSREPAHDSQFAHWSNFHVLTHNPSKNTFIWFDWPIPLFHEYFDMGIGYWNWILEIILNKHKVGSRKHCQLR